MEAISKAKLLKFLFPKLNVAIVGKWVWVQGDTRSVHAELKAEGLRFSRVKKMWYYAGENFRPRRAKTIPYAAIVQKYGEARVQPATATPAETQPVPALSVIA